MFFMGIDGGGTHLRVVITDADLKPQVEVHAAGVNPNAVGQAQATATIQNTIRQALEQSGLSASAIGGVGLGIAGAPVHIAEDWLRAVPQAILPNCHVLPSSDNEIALVGALGERVGVLILAGTGSGAYGRNLAGESIQVGGWGYLIGDEGSGYWLGLEGVKAAIRAFDGRGAETALTDLILAHVGLSSAWDIIAWLYQNEQPHNRQLASLAPLVLAASEHDPVARAIIEQGAGELALHYKATVAKLKLHDPAIGFAGGLLQSDNALTAQLCRLLKLPKRPQARYSAVIGAALLAQMTLQSASATN